MARETYEIHASKDGTVHVSSKFRTAAWAHACFGPKGFAKWKKGLAADLVDVKACACGMQPGQFRKASGQAWTDPKFRERVQPGLFEKPAEQPEPEQQEQPAKKRPARKKAAKKAAKKRPKKAAKKAASKPSSSKPAGGGAAKAGALIRAVRGK